MQSTSHRHLPSTLRPLVLAVLLTLGTVSFAASKHEPFVGVWKVNWENSAPAIQEVPSMFSSRVKSVEEFRNLVAQRANGLVVEIYPDHTAVFHYPTERAKLVWDLEGERHDVWLQQKFSFMVAIGHGLKVTGPDTATLKYQVEWNEDAATRVFLLLERQGPAPKASSATATLLVILFVGVLTLVIWLRWRRQKQHAQHHP
jgi:hypothetical protein